MRLVDERNKKRLSQLQAAKGIGISQSMLAMLESGERSGTDKVKQKIANFYGVTVGYLFFEETITKRDKAKKEAIK